ncbi:MAG: hypothetical protein ABFD89_05160 [Bryobacteraceae bacterium]
MWTLVSNGVEKVLGEGGWGIDANFSRERSDRACGVFRCRTIEGFDAGVPQFAYGQAVTVWRDRTAIGAGGTVYFAGFWDDGVQCVDGGRQWIDYTAHDVWWLLEQLVFMQTRKQFNGTEGHVPTGVFVYINLLCPEVYLGEKLDIAGQLYLQTNGDQIEEVLDWVNECYNPTKRGATTGRDDAQDVVQIGTIDPQALIAVERASGVYCSEAITRVLRLTPDAITSLDYTTIPPTLNVRTFAKWNYTTSPPTFVDFTNLPEVTINITEEQERSVRVQARHYEQLAGVAIYYRWVNETDGVAAPAIWVDKYPATITDYTPYVSRHLIELAGFSMSHVRASVVCNDDYPPSMLFGTAAQKKAWLLAHDQTMNDERIDPNSIVVGDVSIVDGAGSAVNLGTYPNELRSDSAVPYWISRTVVPATVMIKVAFNKYADDARTIPDEKKTDHVIRHELNLTNAQTYTYVALSHVTSSETAPTGVSEQVYRGLQSLQHAVSLTLTGEQLQSTVDVGVRLKLVGPTTTFENIVVRSMVERPHYGEATINGGPLAALDVDALITLARSTRFRTTYNMPSGRADGGTGGSSESVDSSVKPGAKNTSHGVGGAMFDSAVGHEQEDPK